MVEFALEMGKRLSHVLSDGLPDEAKHHLLNAQRELITALVIMYEHQAGTRRADFAEERAAATTRRRAASPARPRSTKIPIQ
jgi:cation transport regulator ChaB